MTVGFSKLANANSARKGLEEGAKQSALTEIGTGAMSIGKEVGTAEVVMQLAYVSGGVSKVVSALLKKNSILLSPNCNIEREQILKEVQTAVFKATKTHKHAKVINELASGVLKASSEHYGLGKVLYNAHKVGSMVDITAKIEPIIDDLKQAIENIITTAAARARQRLKGPAAALSSDQQTICDSLSHNIGSIVGSSILNLIQRKISTPIISDVAGELIDKSLKTYKYEKQEILAAYSAKVNVERAEPGPLIPQKPGQQDKHLPQELSREELAMLAQIEGQGGCPGSENNDQFITILSAKMKQPIYLFKDGRLEKCYGGEELGAPISIGYDTKSKSYISLGGSREYTIYEAIASQTKGRHSAGELIKIHYDETRANALLAEEMLRSNEVARSKAPTSGLLELVDYSLLLILIN